jgi:deoxyribose-phosphate aldolase
MSDASQIHPPQPIETYESLAKRIDYHLLDPTLSTDAVAAGCRTARDYGVRAVVLRPCDVELAAQWLRGSEVILAGVAGYPEGTSTTASKLYEAREVLKGGAKEIEFVINPARMISRQFQHVETELMQIAKSCHEAGARLAVIYNNRWFADDLKIIGTKICRRVEVDVLGLDHSEHDLEVIRPLLKDVLELKHSGHIESLDQALAAREAGYRSMATTVPEQILEAWKEQLSKQREALQSTQS